MQLLRSAFLKRFSPFGPPVLKLATRATAITLAAIALMTGAPRTAFAEPNGCEQLASDPEAALAHAVGLQAYIYGYPLVDLLIQSHNETERTSPNQLIAAPVNTFAVYPYRLTPQTQGNLRAPNADTIYFNAWIDLSDGPVVLQVPEASGRYYTIALTDLFGIPSHIGRRTTGTSAAEFVIAYEGQAVDPEELRQVFRVRSTIVWALGRMFVANEADEAAAVSLARQFTLVHGLDSYRAYDGAAQLAFPTGLEFFVALSRALKLVVPPDDEAAMLSQFERFGIGQGLSFDPEQLSAAARTGLSCAAAQGPALIDRFGWHPTSIKNGWMVNSRAARPGHDYLLRATIARGGYVNEAEEAIYPATVTDSDGAPLDGSKRYEIRFAKDELPLVDAFWSITPYATPGYSLTDNAIGRFAIGDRTEGLIYERDGSLRIVLSQDNPGRRNGNWLPIPPGHFTLVSRFGSFYPPALVLV